MSSLDSKVAIVTGAARQRGIGRGIALGLAQRGADVVVVGSPRPSERYPDHEKESGWLGGQSVVAEIEALGRRALGIDADLTKPEHADRIVAEAIARFGRIDILVNNAGLGYAGEHSLWEIDDREWYEVVDINLNAIYLMTSRVLRTMVSANTPGRIISISSAAGRMGLPQYGAYCATKWGVIGLTQMLAIETAPHKITVNCIAPGSVDTDMMDGTFSHMATRFKTEARAMKQAVVRSIALGRQGAPKDIADAVAFFASDEASWITGQTLNVTGGTPMN